jgi:hypothetical protein
MSNDQRKPKLSRRNAIKLGGIALASVLGQHHITEVQAQQRPPSTTNAQGLQAPIFAPADSNDPAIHARAENLFWSQIMMEHAGFFAMLMPGTELNTQRTQAENFQRTFQTQLERVRTTPFDRNNYASFSRSTIELMKPLIEYKQRMLDAQNSGKIRTLVFSMFFEHTNREAQRAAARLERIATGDVALNYNEVVDFWAAIMSEHNDFIAHLLDPKEQDLIGQALDASAVFQGFKQGNYEHAVRGGDVLLVTEELIDFETALQEGIESNAIKSIIYPVLADHIRRETLKFVDELKRSGNKT